MVGLEENFQRLVVDRLEAGAGEVLVASRVKRYGGRGVQGEVETPGLERRGGYVGGGGRRRRAFALFAALQDVTT